MSREFHRAIVLSSEPVAIVLPSGLKLQQVIGRI